MTATPLIKDQSVVAFPSSGTVRADATTMDDAIFAEIFAAIDVTGPRGPDRLGETPAGPSLVRATDPKKPVDNSLVTGDSTLFAKMLERAKASVFVPEAGDPSDTPQTADIAILGDLLEDLPVLNLIGDPAATDVPVDLDQVVSYLARLLKGDANKADAALSGITSEDVSHEAVGEGLDNSGVEAAIMLVDGHLAIMGAGALGPVSNETATNSETATLTTSAPQQTTKPGAPQLRAENATHDNASASPVITATITLSPSARRPLTVLGQMGTASVLTAAMLEKSSVSVARPDVRGAVVSQNIDTPFTRPVENPTIKVDALSAMQVSSDPVIRIAGFVSGAEVAGLNWNALSDGITFQPATPDAKPTASGALALLSGQQIGPTDQSTVQTAPVVPTADSDLMYLESARSNIVSALPLVIAPNMKTGRMRDIGQADRQPSDQRLGLGPQPLAGSDIFGLPTAGKTHATVTRIMQGDVPAQTENDPKPATATNHRANAQVASDIAGPQISQPSTQTPAITSSSTSAVPMAQSSGLPAMLDVRRQGWTQTLVQRAAGLVQSGGVLTLRILPQHLGQITLKISEGRRGLDLRIVTEVASTATMLRGVESQISNAFEGAGLMLGEFSADTGKGGGTAFGDDDDNGDPALAGGTDADETDAGMVSDDTAQNSLLNIIL